MGHQQAQPRQSPEQARGEGRALAHGDEYVEPGERFRDRVLGAEVAIERRDVDTLSCAAPR